jgi:hypothetical protein
MPSVCICVWARYYYLAESSNCRAHISQFDLLGQFLSIFKRSDPGYSHEGNPFGNPRQNIRDDLCGSSIESQASLTTGVAASVCRWTDSEPIINLRLKQSQQSLALKGKQMDILAFQDGSNFRRLPTKIYGPEPSYKISARCNQVPDNTGVASECG